MEKLEKYGYNLPTSFMGRIETGEMMEFACEADYNEYVDDYNEDLEKEQQKKSEE